MTERTYGRCKGKLAQIEDFWSGNDVVMDMAAHIRELQTENAKLIESVDILDKEYCEKCEEYNNLEGELFKLKAERRNLAMRVARSSFNQGIDYGYDVDDGNSRGIHVGTLIENIVSQELAE